jgi:hypothetical protein
MKPTRNTPKNTELVLEYLLENCEFKVKLLTKPNFLAKVDVDFFVMKIKGFVVRQKDNDCIWVNPPCVPLSPPAKWLRIFWSENADFWEKLSKKILNAYEKESSQIKTIESKSWEQIADEIEL